MARIAAVVVLAVVGAAGAWLAISNNSDSRPEAPHPAPSSHGHIRHRMFLGVDVAADPTVDDVRRYHARTGHRPAALLWFQSWNEPLFYPEQLAAAREFDSVPIITWDPSGTHPARLADIAAGRYDDYLRSSARLAASADGPLLIRFAHEMNLRIWPWSPAEQHVADRVFVRAWRHVVRVFRDQGAANVQWVWSPNINCGGGCPFDNLYPGDRFVDWVGLDGYNYGPARGRPWTPLGKLFAASYADVTALTQRPLMISATGSAEQGGDKATWLRKGLLHAVPHQLPRVRGVVYTDRRIEEDWSVTTSPATLRAWRAVVSSPLTARSRSATP